MSLYTNTGLVKHAKTALRLPNVYMHSMILREITPAYYKSVIDRLKSCNKNIDGTGYTAERMAWLEKNIVGKGYYGVDCVCLVKSYYWSGKADGGVGSPKYTGSNDVNAGEMYRRAKVKGPIKTMPEVPGLILYSATHPHIGIYIGNGETIESTLGYRGDGIVKHKMDSFWEYWFECPYIEYAAAAQTPAAPAGDRKPEARKLLYVAALRKEPTPNSELLGKIPVGSTVDVYPGTETGYMGDRVYTYVKVRWNGLVGWIVKSALK